MSFPAPAPLPGFSLLWWHLHLPVSQREVLEVNMNFLTTSTHAPSHSGQLLLSAFPGIWKVVMEEVLTTHSGTAHHVTWGVITGQTKTSSLQARDPHWWRHSTQGCITKAFWGHATPWGALCEYLGTYSPGGRRPILKTSQFCPRQICWLGTKRSCERSYYYYYLHWRAGRHTKQIIIIICRAWFMYIYLNIWLAFRNHSSCRKS